MLDKFLLKRSHIAALHDVIMAAASFVFALYLRLGEDFLAQTNEFLLPAAFLFTGVCAIVFSIMGLYKGVWRYASLKDIISITKSVSLAILIFLPLLFMFNRLDSFPRSVLIINWLVLLAFLGAPRVLYRMIKDKNISLDIFQSGEDTRIPVLLVGISDSAVNFIRENSCNTSNYKVVALIDNDKSQIGRYVYGIKVYGKIKDIPKVIKKLSGENHKPQRIILSSDYLDAEVINNLLKIAGTLGFSLAKLPKMSDFKDNIEKTEVKPVAIEDLLGRAQKSPDLGRRKELVSGKKILVTGAGGTIGSELVRQISCYNPESVTLLEISEFNLYKISKELESVEKKFKINKLIGDVRNKNFLDKLFTKENFDIVFHAAALKHVPIVEDNLAEAILTNIIGSKNIADLCIKYQINHMVMISTDKAVNPTSLMGVTKRIAELYVQGLGNSGKNKSTGFSTVRFGNVLGSSGSVIPLFQSQLEQGGPVTVTHPDMIRYFMTVPEAVELVLQASTLNNTKNDSSIFVLDMGKPVKIKDLALKMIKLAGLEPEKDIKVKYTGIRPGEKLYEELYYDSEEKEDTLYEGILKAKSNAGEFKKIENAINQIQKNCDSRSGSNLVGDLVDLVPEYHVPDSIPLKDAA